MEKVVFWYGPIMKELDKGEVFKFLSEKSINTHLDKTFLGTYLKSNYRDSYDIILENLHRVTCIQVYKDGTIRLRLKTDYYEEPKSIFLDLETYNDEVTKNMIEELITFSCPK